MFKKPLVRAYFWGGEIVRAGNFPKHHLEFQGSQGLEKFVAWNHQYWVYKVGLNQFQMELQRLFHPQKVGLFHLSCLIISVTTWKGSMARNSYMYWFFSWPRIQIATFRELKLAPASTIRGTHVTIGSRPGPGMPSFKAWEVRKVHWSERSLVALLKTCWVTPPKRQPRFERPL